MIICFLVLYIYNLLFFLSFIEFESCIYLLWIYVCRLVSIGYTQFIFTVEIRGRDHAQEIIEALHKQYYTKVECDGM